MDFFSKEYLQDIENQDASEQMLRMVIGNFDSLKLIQFYETIPTIWGPLNIRTEDSEIDSHHLFVPSKALPGLGQILANHNNHYCWRGEWLRNFLGYPQKILLEDGLLEKEHSFDRPYAELVLLEQEICQKLFERYPLTDKNGEKFKNWKELWFFYELSNFRLAIELQLTPTSNIPISKTEAINRSRKHLKALDEIVREPESTIKGTFGQSDKPFFDEVQTLMANLAEENEDFDKHFFRPWQKLKKRIERQAKENPNVQIPYCDEDSGLQHTGKSKQVSKNRERKPKKKGFSS